MAFSEEAGPKGAANAVVFTSPWSTSAAPRTAQGTGRPSEGSRPWELAGSHQAPEDPSPALPGRPDRTARVRGEGSVDLGESGRTRGARAEAAPSGRRP